jgi:Zn-dependent peptidase ImmA (M78 family)
MAAKPLVKKATRVLLKKPKVVKFDPRLLPTSITIMGKTYEVVVVKGLQQDGEELDGQMTSSQQQIRISASHGAMEQAVDTLFHELFHAAEHNVGLDHNEEWVRPISTQVMAILKGNPILAHLILGDYDKVRELLKNEQ